MVKFEGREITGQISMFNMEIKEEHNDFAGTLWNDTYGFAFDFHGVAELLGILDRLFNHVNFPMATHELRMFRKGKEKKYEVPQELYEIDEGFLHDRVPQFHLHVQFRQNSTWQGTLEWVSMQRKQRFDSELDFIKLLIEASLKNKEDGVSVT